MTSNLTAEQRRLAILREYGALDSAPEAELDDIVTLASEICGTPMALITLIDESRQWFKARVGISLTETARQHAFCTHALHGPDLLLVPDATQDPRFADNPYVRGDPNIRFYAGAALITPEGERLGTLSVLDRYTRELTREQQKALRVLSRQVMAHLELGRRLRAQQRSERQQRELAGKLERERLRLIEAQAVAKVGSWETDLSTLEVSWSPETHRIFHTDQASFRPTHEGFLALVHPDDRAAVDQAFWASVNSREPCVIEHRLLLADGAIKIVEERWQMFFNDSGQPLRATGTCRDVTARRQLEQERVQLMHNLGERVKELSALHHAADLLRNHEQPLPEILTELAELLPPAMQYPEISAARISFGAVKHATAGWRESPWELCSRFTTLRGTEGVLQISYLEERGPEADGPFLAEERKLLDSVAEMLRGTIDRRDAESVVGEIQRQQSLILDSVTEGIHGLDLQGRIVFENAAGAAMLGWKREELLGRHSHTAIHHHHRDGAPYPVEACPIYRTLRDGVVRQVGDEVFFRKDGSAFPVEYTCSPVRDASGSITGAVVSFRDITSARASAEALKLTEERFRRTFFGAPIGIVVSTPEGRLIQVNDSYCRMLGFTEQELIATDVNRLAHPDDRALINAELRQMLAGTRDQCQVEKRYVTKDGGVVWCRVGVSALRDASGAVQHFVRTVENVTESRAAADALRRSEERFREMAENIGDIFFNYDSVHNRLLYANQSFERIWGRPLSWLYANPTAYRDDVHSEDRALAAKAFADQLDGQKTDVDFRIIRPDGSVRWIREHAVPVRDAEGRTERIVGTMRDVTERRAITERVRESEERFRLLAKATNDAVWDWNLVTDEVWWNEGYKKLFGHRRDEVQHTSRSWTDFIHPEDLSRVVDAIHRVIDGNQVAWADEYRFRCEDGSYIHVADRGEVLRDASGKAVRMIGGMTDLTPRKQAEEKLREQAALLDQAQDAIIVRDLEHRIVYANRSAERFYKRTAAELVGHSSKELLYGDPAPFLAATEKVLQHGDWAGEIEQIDRDGTPLTVEGRWTLLRDESGQPKSILAINTDITERKKLEQQFLRAQRMESIGTLAGGIAHDLNNLLAPITMGVELLRRFEPSPKTKPIIDNIERSARRGSDLVKQVLSFARGVEGARVLLQIHHVVREVESIIRNTFPKNIAVETSLPESLWSVTGDPTQLSQILLNLCVNARDAMPDGGTLTLAADNIEIDEQYAVMNRGVAPGRYVLLHVTDTGIGMTKEIQDRIFDPFFTTKEIGKGTGLGLSTVLGIVRSHGGFVNVYSEIGKGSTFKVYLPAQEGTADEESGAADADKFPRGNGELILVVDDEASVLDITKQTLEAFGYRVITAEDGAQGIAQFAIARREISAVLTDMMMPVMDGPALIVALRRIDPSVLIIAASGLNANGNVAKAANLGVKHFLGKPYTATALLGILHHVLSMQNSRPPL